MNPKSLLFGLPAAVLRDGALTTEDLPGYENLPDDILAESSAS